MAKPLGDVTTVPTAHADLTGMLPTAAVPVLTVVSAQRYNSHAGTVLVTADYALSSGWGTSPTFTAVRGTDQAAAFTITAKATVGANPTITLTFHDGTWTNAPIVVCGRTEIVAATGSPSTSVSNEFVPTSVTATQIVFTFNGTPVANSTYGCSFICMGT
jgi:hypothetical protein